MDNDAEYSLFNYAALQKSASSNNQNPGAPLLHSGVYSRYNPDGFHQKVIPEDIEAAKKKRGRKKKPIQTKSNDDPNITIKEIIENSQQGEPTVSDIKQQQERISKLQQKRALKKAIKDGNALPEDEIETQSSQMIKKEPVAHSIMVKKEEYRPPSQKLVLKDGKMVIEEEDSNQVAIPQKQQVQVIQDKKKSVTTSMSFKTRNHTKKWSDEETRKFLRAIEVFGSDFSMIAKLFPLRDRTQIMNKYKKEEKQNPQQVDHAFKEHKLSRKKSVKNQIQQFQKMLVDNQLPDTRPDMSKFNSNSSLDSMDKNILHELRNLFVNEVMGAKKDLALPSTTMVDDIQKTNKAQIEQIKEEQQSQATREEFEVANKDTNEQQEKSSQGNQLLKRFT